MSKFENWSGNLPAMTRSPEIDAVDYFRQSIQAVLGRRFARGETVGRTEAEILYKTAVILTADKMEAGRYLADDD